VHLGLVSQWRASENVYEKYSKNANLALTCLAKHLRFSALAKRRLFALGASERVWCASDMVHQTRRLWLSSYTCFN
jgi:hypothetical protein